MIGVKRTDSNLMFLYAAYLAALHVGNTLDSNYTFLFGMILPASVFAYPATLLLLCVISELWTREDAQKLVVLGLSTKFIGIIFLGLVRVFDVVPNYVIEAKRELWELLGTSLWEVSGQLVLGKNIRFWTVSIVSFCIAQSFCVDIFNLLLRRHKMKHGSPWGGRWLRYLTAALSGECLEVVLFITLSFFPQWDYIWKNIVRHVYVRSIFTFCTLPLFYMITWRHRRRWTKCPTVL